MNPLLVAGGTPSVEGGPQLFMQGLKIRDGAREQDLVAGIETLAGIARIDHWLCATAVFNVARIEEALRQGSRMVPDLIFRGSRKMRSLGTQVDLYRKDPRLCGACQLGSDPAIHDEIVAYPLRKMDELGGRSIDLKASATKDLLEFSGVGRRHEVKSAGQPSQHRYRRFCQRQAITWAAQAPVEAKTPLLQGLLCMLSVGRSRVL